MRETKIGAGIACYMIAGYERCIYGQSAGAGLGQGRKVEHFVIFQPMLLFNKILFHQRHDNIPAAEGEGAEGKGGPEQFPKEL